MSTKAIEGFRGFFWVSVLLLSADISLKGAKFTKINPK